MSVLFVQGAGPNVHDQWDQALVDSLSRALGCDIAYPRMPDEAEPSYERWKAALIEAFASLSDGALLVGHSVGGTVLAHVLAEHRLAFRPGAVALVAAPFIGPSGWPNSDLPARTAFELDGFPVLIVHGTADSTVPPAHAALYAGALPGASVLLLEGRDHQLDNDATELARALTTASRGP